MKVSIILLFFILINTGSAVAETAIIVNKSVQVNELTVKQISGIEQVINNVNESVSIITAAVEDQSMTMQEFVGRLRHAAEGIEEINENIASSTEDSKKISRASNAFRERQIITTSKLCPKRRTCRGTRPFSPFSSLKIYIQFNPESQGHF